MKKGREFLLLLIIIAVFIAMNYTSLNSFVTKNISPKEYVSVERVVDGVSVKMLGIYNKSV